METKLPSQPARLIQQITYCRSGESTIDFVPADRVQPKTTYLMCWEFGTSLDNISSNNSTNVTSAGNGSMLTST